MQSKKQKKQTLYTKPYLETKFWMEIVTNSQDKKVVALKNAYNKNTPYTVELTSECMGVLFSDLGPSPSKFNEYTVTLVETLNEKLTAIDPEAITKSSNFVKWLKDITRQMLEKAWETKGVMENHKKKYEEQENPKEAFIEGATLSMFSEYDDQNTIVFKRKHQNMNGENMRPKIWKVKSKMDDTMVEFSEEVPWVSKNSILQVAFRLEMYDMPQSYGISGKLGKDVIAVYLENYERKKKSIPYIAF